MTSSKTNWFYVFAVLTTIVGTGVLAYAGSNLSTDNLGWELIPISLFTLIVGSRIVVYIKSLKTSISISDVFIFLLMFLYGGEIATILCAIEAYLTSSRFTKQIELRLINASGLAIATFFSFIIPQYFFGPITHLIKDDLGNTQVLALMVICFTYYFINAGIISTTNALRKSVNVLTLWKENYIWVFIPFLGSISLAFFTATAIYLKGYYALLIIIPIIGIIFFTYSSQNGKLEAITEKAVQAENHVIELTESEGRFRNAFNNAPIGMALVSPTGKWLQVNDSLCDILGYSQAEFLSANYKNFIYSDDLINFLSRIALLVQGKKTYFHRELRFIHKEGNPIWTQTGVSLLTEKTENSKIIFQIQDVTARRKAEEKLRHDAFFDSLTGLANRTQLMQSLENLLKSATDTDDSEFALAFIDLDRFKNINDSIGYTVGDRVLNEVANRLRKELSTNCVNLISRIESDEFIVLFNNFQSREEIIEIVEHLQKQLSICYKIVGQEIFLSASIGLVFNNNCYKNPEEVLRDGDAALREAKTKKLSSVVLFDEKMSEKAVKRLQLENDIRGAIERNELYLVYQPIIRLNNNELAGFEALIRWQHPKLGFISPVDFIPITEEIGFIVEIGKFVIETACKQIKDWQTKYEIPMQFNVSVNVSAKQLLQKDFVTDLLGSLERHAVKPSQLKIEITESIVIENLETTVTMLKHLRALGIQISMDDFGTGYSSLGYLYRLPITTLKIDRSFVTSMNDDEPQNEEIIKTILLLANNLKLDVVAEGIETKEQNLILEKLGCRYGQGYLFSKPLENYHAEEFIGKFFQRKSYAEFDFIPPETLFEPHSIN